MDKFMNFLFKIDEVVFEKKIVQSLLIVLWIYILSNIEGFFFYWLVFGLVVYIWLTARNFQRSGVKQELEFMKSLYEKNGIFPFVKGFNYCILLGPFSLILDILLNKKT